MTVKLPTIQWLKKKKRCSDCNRGTHLFWQSAYRNRYRLCRACAEKRRGVYREAVKRLRAG